MATNSQNGDIIVLAFPHFVFNNDEGRGWGSGIGAKHRSLSCFLLAGGLRLLWRPGWGLHSSFSGQLWRGWYPCRYNWLNFWLAVADMWSKRILCTVLMIQGRKLKNMRARNIGIRMGIGQENHCEMLFPRGLQESSNSLLHFSNCSWSCLILFFTTPNWLA
jgi:hypothetical protein